MPLPGAKENPEFDRACWSIRSGQADVLKTAPRTSWGNLNASYRNSRNYPKLADGTRQKFDTVLNSMIQKNAKKDVRKVTRQQIRAIHEKYADTPRMTDCRLQILRLLPSHAKNELDWIEANPAAGIKLSGTQKAFELWPTPAIEALEKATIALNETDVLTAKTPGTGTGQRAGDLCSMPSDHFDGKYMAVTQDKIRERVRVFCPAFLRDTPTRGAFILVRNTREPLGYSTLENRFRKVGTAARPVCDDPVMHGWRYTAAVALAAAGASVAEI